MTGAPLTVSDGRHLLGKITELAPKRFEARDPAGAVGTFATKRDALAALVKPPAREGAAR